MYFPENANSIKFFEHPSFAQVDMRKTITGEMPESDNYEKAYKKIQKIRANKINPEMLPCYQSPLLTFAQEQHLFRKMNFFKYRTKQLIERDSRFHKRLAFYAWSKALQLRNQIAESNFRLATQIIKHKNKTVAENTNVEQILSDAYFDVLKAVDYFNFTFGHRFSTYATWVVKKNFFREIKNKNNSAEKTTHLDESRAEMIEDRSSPEDGEKTQSSQKNLIRKLIGMLVRENIGTDRIRQAYVLEQYFGVNGREKLTLEQISETVGVTKERVRQLKEKGLQWIREKVEELGIEIDD